MASSTSATWEFDAHLNSTTHHGHPIYNNPTSDSDVTSWISFWRDKTGKDVPKFCPGVHPSDVRFATHAHEFGYKISGFKKVVGAHVRIKDATGNVRFGIVPACNKCNSAECNLQWKCVMVTVVDLSRLTFVGRFMVDASHVEDDEEDPKNKKEPQYWTEIISIANLEIDNSNKSTPNRRKHR